MIGRRVLLVLMAVALMATGASAAVLTDIKAISGTTIDTTFTYSDGGLSTLEISGTDVTDVIVEDEDGTQVTYDDGTIYLQTFLDEDLSSGDGVTTGLFAGGTIEVRDAADNLLLGAELSGLAMKENSIVTLDGLGGFQVVGGSLADEFGSEGTAFEFLIALSQPDDFQSSFSGESDLTLMAIPFGDVPEPTTMGLLTVGGLVTLLGRRRR